MRGVFDFSEDTIVAWGVLYNDSQYNDVAFPVPEDCSPERYDYVPSVKGVYDPNGFVPKEPPQPTPCPTCNRI